MLFRSQAGGAVASLALALVIFLLAIIALAVWGVLVHHFVVTIMAIDRLTFRPAWQKFWQIYKNNVKDFWLYILILIGLRTASSILEGIVFLIVLISFLIVGFLVFGLGYLIFAVLLKTKILFWIFALVLGIPTCLAALAAIVAIGLPFAVFFRSFSLYFFSSLNCGYVPLALSNAKESV